MLALFSVPLTLGACEKLPSTIVDVRSANDWACQTPRISIFLRKPHVVGADAYNLSKNTQAISVC